MTYLLCLWLILCLMSYILYILCTFLSCLVVWCWLVILLHWLAGPPRLKADMLLFCLSELDCFWTVDCLVSCFHWRWLESKPAWFAFGIWFDLFCFSGLFLVFGFLSFGSCNGSWILSALFIHQLGIHLGILSILFGIFQLCFGQTSYASYIPASIILILGPLCPFYIDLGSIVSISISDLGSNLYKFVQ